jgi:hypothetical protein
MDGFDALYTMPTARLGAAGARWLDHGQVLWWPGGDPCNPGGAGNASAPTNTNRLTNPSLHIFANGSAQRCAAVCRRS